MARNSDRILQLYSRVQGPCPDYCGLTVSPDEITLNIWHVASGPHVYPEGKLLSADEFVRDKQTQRAVQDLFGKHALEFAMKVCRQEKSFESISTRAFLKIINYLATRDVLNLSQTSKMMFERCNTNDSWQLVFRKCFKASSEELREGRCMGWRNLLIEKIEENLPKAVKTSRKPRTPTTLKPLKAVTKTSSLLNNGKNRIAKSVSQKSIPNTIRNPIRVQSSFLCFENNSTTNKTKFNQIKTAASLTVAKNSTQTNFKTSPIKTSVNNNYVKDNAKKMSPVLKPLLKPIKDVKIKIDVPSILARSAACNNINSKASVLKSKFTLKQK